jgi:hypothetical protein
MGPKGVDFHNIRMERERKPLSMVNSERSFEMTRTICVCLVLGGALFSQASFEAPIPLCPAGAGYPVGCGMGGGPEGVSWNGLPAAAAGLPPRSDSVNAIGMPCDGARYLRMTAAGPVAVPQGGPFSGGGTAGGQVYIPIPAGQNLVSFCWDFYNADSDNSATFNDGMQVDVVGSACGTSLAQLVYADTFTPDTGAGTGADVGSACPSNGGEILPAGAPQSVVNAAIPSGGAFIRVTVWNGGDDGFDSFGVIDGVMFSFGIPPCVLQFSSPNGPGSIRMQNTPCPAAAGVPYLIGIALAPGIFPNGWYGGVDIAYGELIGEYSQGYPFAATLDAAGASDFGPTPAGSLPSGLQVWAATGHFGPGFGFLIGYRPAVTYIIP